MGGNLMTFLVPHLNIYIDTRVEAFFHEKLMSDGVVAEFDGPAKEFCGVHTAFTEKLNEKC
jgi:hypothetical protein